MIQSQSLGQGADDDAPGIDLAPLIDVVFILLIFFLVTTTFTRDRGIVVERPGAAHSAPIASDVLRIQLTASGACFVAGRPVALADLEAELGTQLGNETRVVVVPDRSVTAGRLVEVMDRATAAGAREVTVATREVQR